MKILDSTDPLLYRPALPVIASEHVDPYVGEMQALMKEKRGTGLAAPQCGILYRFFVYGGRRVPGIFTPIPFGVVVNPIITWRSEDLRPRDEGCLSFPGRFTSVRRPESIRVTYIDRTNSKTVVNELLGGYLARLFQHEIDHLDGICIFPQSNPKISIS